MKIYRLLELFFLLFVFGSCSKETSVVSSCGYYEEVPPRFMSAPDSVKADSTITIMVFYDNQKPCQNFHSFISNSIDSTETISIRTIVDTCNCQNQAGFQAYYFKYQAPHNFGHSIIKIHVTNTLFYADTIVVY